MLAFRLQSRCCRASWQANGVSRRCLRSDQRRRPASILDDYADVYRPEVESEMEYLAVQTSRNRALQINYEKERQQQRQRTARYHILRRKYVAHPNDVQVDPYVKNHMQFLRKNYPERWSVETLAQSFNQSIDNVRLILQQRTRRALRVRPRSPTSLFGVEDEAEREKIIRQEMMKRDLPKSNRPELANTPDSEPVDHRVLAEESNLLPRQRPSDEYMKRENDGFFSNVISSSAEDQPAERDISAKPKLLPSSPTLLERVARLRLTPVDTSADVHSSNVDEQRLDILRKMQAANDAIVDMNERKQKFVRKPTSNK